MIECDIGLRASRISCKHQNYTEEEDQIIIDLKFHVCLRISRHSLGLRGLVFGSETQTSEAEYLMHRSKTKRILLKPSNQRECNGVICKKREGSNMISESKQAGLFENEKIVQRIQRKLINFKNLISLNDSVLTDTNSVALATDSNPTPARQITWWWLEITREYYGGLAYQRECNGLKN